MVVLVGGDQLVSAKGAGIGGGVADDALSLVGVLEFGESKLSAVSWHGEGIELKKVI